jgi:hypothetical protein
MKTARDSVFVLPEVVDADVSSSNVRSINIGMQCRLPLVANDGGGRRSELMKSLRDFLTIEVRYDVFERDCFSSTTELL